MTRWVGETWGCKHAGIRLMLMDELSYIVYWNEFTLRSWCNLYYYELWGKFASFGVELLLRLSFAQHYGVGMTEIFSSLLLRGLKQSQAEGFVKSQVTWFPSHPALGNFMGDFTVKMDRVWRGCAAEHYGLLWRAGESMLGEWGVCLRDITL